MQMSRPNRGDPISPREEAVMHRFLLTTEEDWLFSLTEFVVYAEETRNSDHQYYIEQSRSRKSGRFSKIGRVMLVDLTRHVAGPASPDDLAISNDLMTDEVVSEALS
jgi:hypothetical protein